MWPAIGADSDGLPRQTEERPNELMPRTVSCCHRHQLVERLEAFHASTPDAMELIDGPQVGRPHARRSIRGFRGRSSRYRMARVTRIIPAAKIACSFGGRWGALTQQATTGIETVTAPLTQ